MHFWYLHICKLIKNFNDGARRSGGLGIKCMSKGDEVLIAQQSFLHAVICSRRPHSCDRLHGSVPLGSKTIKLCFFPCCSVVKQITAKLLIMVTI